MAASRPALPTRWFLLPAAVLVATFLAALVHFATRDSAEWAGLVDGALALSYLVGSVVVGVPLVLALRFGRWAQGLLAVAVVAVACPLVLVSVRPQELRHLAPLFLAQSGLALAALVGVVARAWPRRPG